LDGGWELPVTELRGLGNKIEYDGKGNIDTIDFRNSKAEVSPLPFTPAARRVLRIIKTGQKPQ
jgi:hypothetical protein